ncbi:ImmA/IrrE family metallo-endopeptidase [Priestia flexa]|uniref:ImmA/IrrE family metallo-endopeptidase n=1 Tax=Priestia flexa TaxID=86664 RepID=UPI002203E81C|nr:hypothetical protein [Priestia flexa]MDT2047975.1 hypothetical protein [Priestia flexa]USY55939.1 hypothetical protein NIZ91_04595 [Bacillus sp. 1780r2a1]
MFWKKDEPVAVHGVLFYGLLSKKQRAILKEIEKVTPPEAWNGVKGVYCLGSVKVQGRDVLGVYYGQFPKQTSAKKQALHFEINYKKYTVKECPIVFIDTMKNKKAHQFAFIVLHELGHHVDRTQNQVVLREGNKQQELFANTYAIEHFLQIEGMESKQLYNIPYLQEAIQQYQQVHSPLRSPFTLRVE